MEYEVQYLSAPPSIRTRGLETLRARTPAPAPQRLRLFGAAHRHRSAAVRTGRARRCGDAKLDAAVASAYGFAIDLTDEQILEKLLALNIERENDETKSVAKQRNAKKISRVKSEHEMI